MFNLFYFNQLKPEYQNQLMDHLDLIILGGYHGIGRRRNLISSFLVGVAIPSVKGEPPKEFQSLGNFFLALNVINYSLLMQ